ncbi:MAG TPA: preprotein translocase subunit YajC [Chloroflexi bacterium]|nr:preprotein translocase subunit YajC [Chloroflexota bacterium]
MFQNAIGDIFILALFAAAIYAFLILPRQREFKKRQRFVRSLSVGTRVTTYGGMIGTVKKVESERGLVTLEVADDIELQFLAAAITAEFDPEAYAESARRALK